MTRIVPVTNRLVRPYRLAGQAVHGPFTTVWSVSVPRAGFFFPHFQNKYNVWAYRAVGPFEHDVYPVIEPKQYPDVVDDVIAAVDDKPDPYKILSIDPGLVWVLQDQIDARLSAMDLDFFNNIPTRERRLREVVTMVKVQQMIVCKERERARRGAHQQGGSVSRVSWAPQLAMCCLTLLVGALPR